MDIDNGEISILSSNNNVDFECQQRPEQHCFMAGDIAYLLENAAICEPDDNMLRIPDLPLNKSSSSSSEGGSSSGSDSSDIEIIEVDKPEIILQTICIYSSSDDKDGKNDGEITTATQPAVNKIDASKTKKFTKHKKDMKKRKGKKENSTDASLLNDENIVSTLLSSLVLKIARSGRDDSDSSSESSDDEMKTVNRDRELMGRIMAHETSIEHFVPKVKNEVLIDELPEEVLEVITLSDEDSISRIGVVCSAVEKMIVIKADLTSPALDADTAFFLDDKTFIGKVFDTFGPVKCPFYSIRMSSVSLANIKNETIVYFAPYNENLTKYVFTEQLKKMKGSDASWMHNHEPTSGQLDYSDDEEERRMKKERKEERKAQIREKYGDEAYHQNTPNSKEPKNKRSKEQVVIDSDPENAELAVQVGKQKKRKSVANRNSNNNKTSLDQHMKGSQVGNQHNNFNKVNHHSSGNQQQSHANHPSDFNSTRPSNHHQHNTNTFQRQPPNQQNLHRPPTRFQTMNNQQSFNGPSHHNSRNMVPNTRFPPNQNFNEQRPHAPQHFNEQRPQTPQQFNHYHPGSMVSPPLQVNGGGHPQHNTPPKQQFNLQPNQNDQNQHQNGPNNHQNGPNYHQNGPNNHQNGLHNGPLPSNKHPNRPQPPYHPGQIAPPSHNNGPPKLPPIAGHVPPPFFPPVLNRFDNVNPGNTNMDDRNNPPIFNPTQDAPHLTQGAPQVPCSCHHQSNTTGNNNNQIRPYGLPPNSSSQLANPIRHQPPGGPNVPPHAAQVRPNMNHDANSNQQQHQQFSPPRQQFNPVQHHHNPPPHRPPFNQNQQQFSHQQQHYQQPHEQQQPNFPQKHEHQHPQQHNSQIQHQPFNYEQQKQYELQQQQGESFHAHQHKQQYHHQPHQQNIHPQPRLNQDHQQNLY